jgi:hypothetical protein
MRFTGDDHKTLRQLLGESLRAIENELSLIREVLETMTKQGDYQKSGDDWLKFQVASLSEQIQDLEKRVNALENKASWEQWLIRQGITIALALFCAWVVLRFV